MVAVVAEFIMASIGGVNPWLLVAIVVLSIPAAMAAVWWRNHRDN